MSQFEENILRSEEETAGFNPGEPDDDTFTVSEEGYPGELPHIADIDVADDDEIIDLREEPAPEPKEADDIEETPVVSETEDINEAEEIEPEDEPQDIEESQEPETEDIDEAVTEDEVTSAEQIDVPEEGSVWDAFGIDDEDSEPEEPTTDSEEPIEDIQDIEDESVPINTEENKEELDAQLISDEEEQIDDAQSDENFKADDELQALLMQDLERSKKRSEVKESKQEPKVEQQEFQPVDDEADAKLIDLSELDYDEDDDEQTVPPVIPIPNKSKKQAHKKVDDDKKRSAFPWKFAAIASAALFLITLGVIVIYLLMYKPEIGNSLGIFSVSSDSTVTQITENNENIFNNTKTEKDAQKDAQKDVDKETSKTIDDSSNMESAKLTEAEILRQDSINTAIEEYKKELAAKEKAEKQAKSIANTKKTSKPKKTNVIKPKPNKSSNSNDLAKKETFIDSDASINKQKKDIKTLNELEEEGVFVVQIYSSPSKDDAEEWLQKLNNKNLDGFISEHKVRDQIWYRVRFGEFNSKDEARAAAMKYGFAQSWIDRIK